MITKITSANADRYRVLFAKATAALRKYDANGNPVGDHPENAVIPATPYYDYVDIDASTFVAGELFIGEGDRTGTDANGNPQHATYRQTELSEHFDATADYYIEIVNGEITSLDEYFEYIQDLKNISPIYTILPIDEELFVIDANSRKIAIPKAFADNGVSVQGDEISEVLYFKIDRYYDMEDLYNDDIFIEWRTPANENGEIFEGVSKPWAIDLESQPGYIVFGWPLASEITKAPGDVTFSVRFYRFEDHALLYSLSTLTNTVTIKPGIDLERTVRQSLETPGGVTDASDLMNERIINSERYDPTARDPEKPHFDENEARENGSAKDIIINLATFNLTTDDTFVEDKVYYQKLEAVDGSSKYAVYNGTRYLLDEVGESTSVLADPRAVVTVLDAEPIALYEKVSDVNAADAYQLYSHIDKVDTPSQKFDRYDVYLTNPVTGEEKDAFYRIRSIVSDAGNITYAWIKMDEAGNILNASQFVSGDVFVPTQDEVFVQNRTYYEKNGNDYNIYGGPRYTLDAGGAETEELADPRAVVTAVGADPIALYERFSETTVNAVLDDKGDIVAANDNFVCGTYQPRLTNRVGRKTDRSYGPVLRITGPAQPVVTNDAIPDTTEDPSYAWSDINGHTVGGAIITNDGEEDAYTVGLTVTAEVDNHGYTTFEWYKGHLDMETGSAEPQEIVVFDDAPVAIKKVASREVKVADAIDTVVSEVFNVPAGAYGSANDGDGFYKCVVHTRLNSVVTINQEVADDTEIYVRVTHAASKAVLEYDNTLVANNYTVNVGSEMKIDLEDNENEVALRNQNDSYTYQWYRYVAINAETTNRDRNNAALGQFAGNSGDQPIEGLTYLSHMVDDQKVYAAIPNTPGLNDNGLYYCKITNHFNGSMFVWTTRFIENIDTSDNY